MKRVLFYFLMITLSLPSLSAGMPVLMEKQNEMVTDLDREETAVVSHEHHSAKYQAVSSMRGDGEHDCCESNDTFETSNRCCEEDCNTCMNECGSTTGFALLTDVSEFLPATQTVSLPKTQKLPLSPYQNTLIPPIS